MKKSNREKSLERKHQHMIQAVELIERMMKNPNQPIDVSSIPHWGVSILEKLGLIETWKDAAAGLSERAIWRNQ